MMLVFLWLCIFTDAQYLVPSLWGWNTNHQAVYSTGAPRTRTSNLVESRSACDVHATYGDGLGFSCPHYLFLSSDTLLASQYDGNHVDFLYGTCATSTDQDCGRCFQIKPLYPERVWNESLDSRQLVLQVINSGHDVRPGQFDLFVGAGGAGVYSACNSDCVVRHCSGGPCVAPLYNGLFDTWNPRGDCYGGGVSVVEEQNLDAVWARCQELTRSGTEYKDQVLWQSCYLSNVLLYHQNFKDTLSTPVKCPEGLTLLTGLRREDDDDLVPVNVHNALRTTCEGSVDNPCFTTYHDCCKPSCGWAGKGRPDTRWPKVDTCNSQGLVTGY